MKYSTGNLRFAPPQAPSKSSGTRQATTYGAGCLPLPGGFGGGGKSSEDCACARWLSLANYKLEQSLGLFINVVKPQNIASGKTLPVLVVSKPTLTEILPLIGSPVDLRRLFILAHLMGFTHV